jgi:uncharacterized protein YaeQ
LTSHRPRLELPSKVILMQDHSETVAHVALKLLAFLLFFRERLQIEPRLDDEDNPFVPDLVQLDYELRPALWVECGEIPVGKLDRLAVKAPEAEIWVLRRSPAEARALYQAMKKEALRPGRYHVLAFDPAMFDELCGAFQNRNEVYWVGATFDPANIQLDFNGLWFDAPFEVMTL